LKGFQVRGTAIHGLPTKVTPIGTDVVLAEDSENRFKKVAIPVSALGGTGDASSLSVINDGPLTLNAGRLAYISHYNTADSLPAVIGLQSIFQKPAGFITSNIPAGATSAIILRGIIDATLSIPDMALRNNGDNVYCTNVGGLTCHDTGSSIVGSIADNTTGLVYLDLINLKQRNSLQRKNIGEMTYNTSRPFSFVLNCHATNHMANIMANFDSLAPILWFEFIIYDTNYSGTKVISDLRFSTRGEVETYVNGFAGAFIMKIYTYHYEDIPTKMNGLNTFYSRLKGRKKYYNYRIATLRHSLDWPDYPPQQSFIDGFANNIYLHFLGLGSIDVNSAELTIGFPTVKKTLHTLWPTKAGVGSVKLNRLTEEQRGRMVYDSDTASYELWNSIAITDLYYKDSCVFSLNSGGGDIVNNYGQFPTASDWKANNNSMVRVYHFVDDINTSRYHYFIIKPIGLDQFLLKYNNPLSVNGGPLQAFIRYKSRSIQSGLILSSTTPINRNDSPLGDGESFRLMKEDVMKFPGASIAATKCKDSEVTLYPFIGDIDSGICSNEYVPIVVKYKVSGAALKLMLKY
jgi:hypothetical protein